jgi:hypothetical protein
MRAPLPTAALAGIPSGLQGQGPWLGRRQLFIRFAGEAETATMYTAAALANELRRATSRSAFHSIAIGGRDALANTEFLAIGGRDALANTEFLAAALDALASPLPVLLATDGQRPEALAGVGRRVALVQVSLDPAAPDAVAERAVETLRAAAHARTEHALVLAWSAPTSDAQLLRAVERAHAASGGTIIVVHPDPAGDGREPDVPVWVDSRWTALMERLVALHADTRLALRLPAPVGMT